MPFVTDVSAFFSEFLGSAMLLFGILMLLDKQNGVPNYFVPVGLFITLFGIGAALGYETGMWAGVIKCNMTYFLNHAQFRFRAQSG